MAARLKPHSVLDILPPLTGSEIERAVDRVKLYGQTLPIEVLNGTIVHGLEEYKGCVAAGIAPKVTKISEPACVVEYVNRGYDLLSKKPHPTEPGAYVASRFIEVKGRAGIGEVGLSSNEFKTAQRLAEGYWLYVVFNCARKPELHTVQDPARLGWKPVVRVESYLVTPATVLGGVTKDDRKPSDAQGST